MAYIKTTKYGQYIIPDPDVFPEVNDEIKWTRVTTAVKALDDTYHLGQWAKRMVAWGVANSDDLMTKAMSVKSPHDDKAKRDLDDIAEEAMQRAASQKKANLGTALHSFTQRVDEGEANVKIPVAMQERVATYSSTLKAHGLKVIPTLIEKTLVLKALGLAGTADRFVHWAGADLPVVFDLKTGGTLDFSKISIAQQLAAYANATHIWDGEKFTKLPEVDLKWGLVLHLPSDSKEVALWRVDIEEGYRLLEMSVGVRAVRSTKGKDLFTEVDPFEVYGNVEATAVEAETPEERIEGLKRRVRAIVALPEGPAKLDALWNSTVPMLTESGHTEAQLDLIERWCDIIESGADL